MQALPPTSTHTHTIILLHGRDSTAKEFAAEFLESQASDGRHLQDIFPGVRWVFPTAPLVPSKRFGCEMSQWFDMWSTEDVHEREGEQDLEGAIARVQEVVAREARAVRSGNVVVGGISQGCAVGIHALLGLEMGVGGFVGLCGWLPQPDSLGSVVKAEAVKTPVFLGHCEDDEVIGVRFGEELRDCLRNVGMVVEWELYEDGGHWLNEPKGVDDLVVFLNSVFERSVT
ncbi:hypothetical protein M409DRAFT_48547 [Zasmidium cellare ATCC 36951]|uniref:Phospholipase/carboxylesterase/thioesterase domain-containing protein n=1 Tax=Zasmidium cellare ATCC 36951 TaxID=1080233 RepID=A0A6A6D5E1_ZASCE|nr:uncharacterized protein M409DRAFT_48547 [Zasmidium cellare ATCC 36951]KAF2173590.1 hypothetical protein M409DRAFT_48547 [Zasmidium cellare ATCC 36951]